MILTFADTGYLIACLDTGDQCHQAAFSFPLAGRALVTSDLVLAEFLNTFSRGWRRNEAAVTALDWMNDRGILVVHHDARRFENAIRFYQQRPDKHWSLTDCASFLIMNRLGIRDALSADKHFEQAGFSALLSA